MLFEPENHNFQGRNHNSSPRPGHRRGQLGERGGQRRIGGGVGEEDHLDHGGDHQGQQTGLEDASEQRRRDKQQKQRHHGLLNSSAGYRSGKNNGDKTFPT